MLLCCMPEAVTNILSYCILSAFDSPTQCILVSKGEPQQLELIKQTKQTTKTKQNRIEKKQKQNNQNKTKQKKPQPSKQTQPTNQQQQNPLPPCSLEGILESKARQLPDFLLLIKLCRHTLFPHLSPPPPLSLATAHCFLLRGNDMG